MEEMDDIHAPVPAQAVEPSPYEASGKAGMPVLPILIVAGIALFLALAASAAWWALRGDGQEMALRALGGDGGRVAAAILDTLDAESFDMALSVELDGVSEAAGNIDARLTLDARGFNAPGSEPGNGEGEISLRGTLDGAPVVVEGQYLRLPPRTYVEFKQGLALSSLPFALDGLEGRWLYLEDGEESPLAAIAPGEERGASVGCDVDAEATRRYLLSAPLGEAVASVTKTGTKLIGDEKADTFLIGINGEGLEAIMEQASLAGGCPAEVDLPEIASLTVAVGNDSEMIREIEATTVPDETFDGIISIRIGLSGFGSRPEVEEPTESAPLDEAIGKLFSEYLYASEGAGGFGELEGSPVRAEDFWDDTSNLLNQ